MIGWLVGAAAGFLGSLGLGGGTLLMLYMSFFEDAAQTALAGMNLMFFLGAGAAPVGVYAFRKLIDWRRVLWTSGAGTLGVLAGWYLSGVLDTGLLSKGFAVLLLLLGCKELFSRKK